MRMYEKEVESLEEKVKKMESEKKDEYDIRKQVAWLKSSVYYKYSCHLEFRPHTYDAFVYT